jgi:hypothetical protein
MNWLRDLDGSNIPDRESLSNVNASLEFNHATLEIAQVWGYVSFF